MSIPTNVIVFTAEAACPSGFSTYSDIDGHFLLAAAVPDTVDAGSNTHTHANADHTHTYNKTTAAPPAVANINNISGAYTTADTHTHTCAIVTANPTGLTVSTDDHSPAYCTLLLCIKD